MTTTPREAGTLVLLRHAKSAGVLHDAARPERTRCPGQAAVAWLTAEGLAAIASAPTVPVRRQET